VTLETQQKPANDPKEVVAAPGVPRIDVEPVHAKHRRSMYEARKAIHPRKAHGAFRRLKWIIMAVTLAIYYLTPWLRWDRGPVAPDQAVLIDLPGRRFYFFFIELWPQEVYYITGLLILAAIGLFLVTSVWGRAWCGYACPQTVWTDLFIAVERFIEGDRNARLRLDRAPWGAAKIRKRLTKHLAWIVIGVLTGGAWVFYFADAPTLFGELFAGEASFYAYLFVAMFTATTYLLGGLAREQVCIYMCPWPRIQGAMVDEDTLTVSYRGYRGEPRGSHKKGETWDGRGDCIDCNQCVAVCPVGIDIRDGSQLECITCALCIDACDEVMPKVGRPTGLIGYDTDANMALRARGQTPGFRLIRPRTIVYTAILAVVATIMLIALLNRVPLDVNVLRDRNPLFVMLSDGGVRNGFTVKLLNKSPAETAYTLVVEGLDNPEINVVGAPETSKVAQVMLTVPADSLRSFRITVAVADASSVDGSADVNFVVTTVDGSTTVVVDSLFKGPDR
jgi:cytochrome c oxidase accessory protein FixG